MGCTLGLQRFRGRTLRSFALAQSPLSCCARCAEESPGSEAFFVCNNRAGCSEARPGARAPAARTARRRRLARFARAQRCERTLCAPWTSRAAPGQAAGRALPRVRHVRVPGARAFSARAERRQRLHTRLQRVRRSRQQPRSAAQHVSTRVLTHAPQMLRGRRHRARCDAVHANGWPRDGRGGACCCATAGGAGAAAAGAGAGTAEAGAGTAGGAAACGQGAAAAAARIAAAAAQVSAC